MHELGLMDAVIRTVDRIIKEENLTHVGKIVLEVGELSGTVPHFITDCFEAFLQTRNIRILLRDIRMDCSSCKLQPICNEVEGLKELHFKN